MVVKKISLHIYPFDVFVVVSKDRNDALKYANKIQDENRPNSGITFHKATTFYKDGYCPVIWLPGKPSSPSETAALAHEAFHCVYYILSFVSITLSSESEESFTYLLEYIIKETLTLLK